MIQDSQNPHRFFRNYLMLRSLSQLKNRSRNKTPCFHTGGVERLCLLLPTQSPCLCGTDGNTFLFSSLSLPPSLHLVPSVSLSPSIFLFSNPSQLHTTFPELTQGPARKIDTHNAKPRGMALKLLFTLPGCMYMVASCFTVLIFEMHFWREWHTFETPGGSGQTWKDP